MIDLHYDELALSQKGVRCLHKELLVLKYLLIHNATVRADILFKYGLALNSSFFQY